MVLTLKSVVSLFMQTFVSYLLVSSELCTHAAAYSLCGGTFNPQYAYAVRVTLVVCVCVCLSASYSGSTHNQK